MDKLKDSLLERIKRENNQPKRKRMKTDGSEKILEFDTLLSYCLQEYPFRMFDDIDKYRMIGDLVCCDIKDYSESSDTDSSYDSDNWTKQKSLKMFDKISHFWKQLYITNNTELLNIDLLLLLIIFKELLTKLI